MNVSYRYHKNYHEATVNPADFSLLFWYQYYE